MLLRTSLTVVPLLVLSVSACGSNGTGSGGNGGSSGSGGGGGSAGGSTGAVACTNGDIVANEANDYKFSSTITLPPLTVKSKTELTFEWGGVTADLIKHGLEPNKDLNHIQIFVWNLPLKTLEKEINDDSVDGDAAAFLPPLSITVDHTHTSAKLMDFEINGMPICKSGPCGSTDPTPDKVLDYFNPASFPQDKSTYTMMAVTGDVLGSGTRMIQSFQVDDSASSTTVTMTKDSTKLDFTADLKSLTPTYIPAGKSNMKIDWSKMTKNALGQTFRAGQITKAFVANYSESPEELSGAKFLDLEIIAKALYRADIEVGSKIDLSVFKKDSDDSPFKGIDSSGTWLVGLQCGDCKNPAPWYITVLKTCN
jgi:hypothetical protein